MKTNKMVNLGIIIFVMLDIGVTIYASRMFSGITREYCLADTFDPSCESGDVVVMQMADYGRMRVGRCVQMDRGALGCYSDELVTFDKYCSGQQTCNIGIYDDKKITTQLSCLNELKPYLEARFICETVHTPRSATCSGPEIIEVKTKGSYISSQVSFASSCGSHNSPWLLEAKPGQKIKLSLLDFGWDPDATDYVGCKMKYGYILDVDTDDIVNICGGTGRSKQLYVSAGSHVQVVLEFSNEPSHQFLLQVQALGCPDYEVPTNAWMEEVNKSLIFGCETSESKWKLKCVDGVWLGIVGTCPKPATTTTPIPNHPDMVVESNPYTLPPMTSNHVVAFGLSCLTLIICSVVVILGYYCTRRFEANYKMKAHLAKTQSTVVKTLSRNQNTIGMKPISRGTPSNTGTDLPTYSMALSKEQCAPPIPHRASSYRGDMSESMMSDYLAPQGGDDNSVQYYILENPTESGGKEEMYQSIHLFSSLERASEAM